MTKKQLIVAWVINRFSWIVDIPVEKAGGL